MDKADAAANRERLVWKGVPGGAFQYNTGGSNGQPLIFYFGRMRQAADAAGRIRAALVGSRGRPARGLYLGCTGRTQPHGLGQDGPRPLAESAGPQCLRDVASANGQLSRRHRGLPPYSIYGYASSVALLAAHAQAQGRRIRLRS